jgi:hypothetical protein
MPVSPLESILKKKREKLYDHHRYFHDGVLTIIRSGWNANTALSLYENTWVFTDLMENQFLYIITGSPFKKNIDEKLIMEL